MDVGHLQRLRRIRDLVTVAGSFDTAATRPACFSGAGFTPELRELVGR